ncbi:MAG: glycoside hydrolase family 32 protein [Actinomycetaceae bacterium]|nr:glycoside hydrolase family 32 protein [Actinomycetaceae bacterium]
MSAVHDPFRPHASYSAREIWLNDPNGLVHIDGQWHMFYQANPWGLTHGNMSWGHAISDNLLDWQELPIAIACEDDEQIYSGSIVYDRDNTSGLGKPGDDGPLLAFYTSAYSADHGTYPSIQAQSIAVSHDRGMTWEKYTHNPILNRESTDFRDPKVLRWTNPTTGQSMWVMVAVEAVRQEVLIYSSPDLLSWQWQSTFTIDPAPGGLWECPDLVPLTTDTGQDIWALIISVNPGGIAGGSGTFYVLGDFDGQEFHPHPSEDLTRPRWLDYGPDFYAVTSFHNAPDNRKICVGWQNNWDYAQLTPTGTWRSSLSVPRELSIALSPEGCPALVQSLVATPQDLHARGVTTLDVQLSTNGDAPATFAVVAPDSTRDNATWPPAQPHLLFTVDPVSGCLVIDRSASGDTAWASDFVRPITVPLGTGPDHRIRLIIDACIVTAIAHDGHSWATVQVFAPQALTEVIYPPA